MNPIHEKISTAYIDSRKLRKMSFKNYQAALKIYFVYLEKNDLDFLRVKIHDAQEFQRHLTTLTNVSGSPHYKISSIRGIIARLASFMTI